jgi:hypothetical protein
MISFLLQDAIMTVRFRGSFGHTWGLNLPSGQSQARVRRNPTAMIPSTTTSQGSPIFQLLSATKQFLQYVTIGARCVRSGKMHRVRGLEFD